MTCKDMLNQLRANSPGAFDYSCVVVNAFYKVIDGIEVRVDFDYDALIIEFSGEYYGRYKPIVRVYKDSSVNATVEVYGYGSFSFPVTDKDEGFEERRRITPGITEFVLDLRLVDEFSGICEWIVSSYRGLKYLQVVRLPRIQSRYIAESPSPQPEAPSTIGGEAARARRARDRNTMENRFHGKNA